MRCPSRASESCTSSGPVHRAALSPAPSSLVSRSSAGLPGPDNHPYQPLAPRWSVLRCIRALRCATATSKHDLFSSHARSFSLPGPGQSAGPARLQLSCRSREPIARAASVRAHSFGRAAALASPWRTSDDRARAAVAQHKLVPLRVGRCCASRGPRAAQWAGSRAECGGGPQCRPVSWPRQESTGGDSACGSAWTAR